VILEINYLDIKIVNYTVQTKTTVVYWIIFMFIQTFNF